MHQWSVNPVSIIININEKNLWKGNQYMEGEDSNSIYKILILN